MKTREAKELYDVLEHVYQLAKTYESRWLHSFRNTEASTNLAKKIIHAFELERQELSDEGLSYFSMGKVFFAPALERVFVGVYQMIFEAKFLANERKSNPESTSLDIYDAEMAQCYIQMTNIMRKQSELLREQFVVAFLLDDSEKVTRLLAKKEVVMTADLLILLMKYNKKIFDQILNDENYLHPNPYLPHLIEAAMWHALKHDDIESLSKLLACSDKHDCTKFILKDLSHSVQYTLFEYALVENKCSAAVLFIEHGADVLGKDSCQMSHIDMAIEFTNDARVFTAILKKLPKMEKKRDFFGRAMQKVLQNKEVLHLGYVRDLLECASQIGLFTTYPDLLNAPLAPVWHRVGNIYHKKYRPLFCELSLRPQLAGALTDLLAFFFKYGANPYYNFIEINGRTTQIIDTFGSETKEFIRHQYGRITGICSAPSPSPSPSLAEPQTSSSTHAKLSPSLYRPSRSAYSLHPEKTSPDIVKKTNLKTGAVQDHHPGKCRDTEDATFLPAESPSYFSTHKVSRMTSAGVLAEVEIELDEFPKSSPPKYLASHTITQQTQAGESVAVTVDFADEKARLEHLQTIKLHLSTTQNDEAAKQKQIMDQWFWQAEKDIREKQEAAKKEKQTKKRTPAS